MEQILLQPVVWPDPLLKDVRLVSVSEPVGEGPVKVHIRQDVFDRVRDIFGASALGQEYLTDEQVERLSQALAERFQIGSFHRSNYWWLPDASRFSPQRSANARRLTADDLPAARRGWTLHGRPEKTPDFLGFAGGYGYAVEDKIVSYANYQDVDRDFLRIRFSPWADIVEPAKGYSYVINVLTVDPERRKGYSTAVVSACVQDMLSRGSVPLSDTEKWNVAMNRIFEKLGFEIAAEDLVVIETGS